MYQIITQAYMQQLYTKEIGGINKIRETINNVVLFKLVIFYMALMESADKRSKILHEQLEYNWFFAQKSKK